MIYKMSKNSEVTDAYYMNVGEIEEAKREGVEFHFLSGQDRLVLKDGAGALSDARTDA